MMKSPLLAGTKFLLMTLLASTTCLFAVHAQVPAKLDPVSFRFNWNYLGSYAPLYLGVSKGFFAEQGVELKPLEGKGSAPTATTVANGSDDFGYVDMGAVARLVDKGLPLKCIALLRPKTAMALLSLKSSNITKPEDLKGKTIGYTPGDSISLLFPGFLKKNGVNIADVKREGIDNSIYLKALIAKQVDVTMGYLDSEGFILENQGEKINAMMFKDYGMNVVQMCLVTSQKMIDQRPDLVKRVTAAYVKSYTYGLQHVDEAIANGKKLFPGVDDKLARRQLEFLPSVLGDSVKEGKPIGYVEPSVWADTLAILHEYSGIQNTDPNLYYTNKFLPGGGK
jgi:NitT/TauT family transport system substrate-binding protein